MVGTMDHKGWKIALALLAILVVGFYAQWFFTHFEAREQEVRREVSPEARRNPLLAAERFLSRIGRTAKSVSGRDRLLQLPPPGDALLVNRFAAHLPPEREDALEEWLRQGGQLIVTAVREWDEESGSGGNRFLDRFGVRLQVEAASGCPDEAPDDSADACAGDRAEPDDTLEVPVAGRAAPLRVAFDQERLLQDGDGAAAWAVGDSDRFHLLQFRVGGGRLTVLSDNGFFHNERIGEADHALFLADLTEGTNKVWLLYSSNMPSLVALLWSNQPFLVVSVLVTALLWLGYLAGFSGPRRRSGARSRRNLLEHLAAAAAYAWSVDRAQRLLAGFRDASVRGWERRHHQLARLDQKARCRWIAERSGLTAQEVELALYEEVGSEQDFVRVSAAQQRVLFGLNVSIHHRVTEGTEISDND